MGNHAHGHTAMRIMRLQVIRVLFTLLFLSGISSLFAQSKSGLQLDVSLDAISYMGDYKEEGVRVIRMQPGINLRLSSAKRAPLKVQFNLGTGSFSEQFDTPMLADVGDAEIPSYIVTRFFYGDLRMRFEPFPHAKVSPYLALGAGLIHFKPEDAEGRNLATRPYTRAQGEYSYNAFIPQLPIHAGLRMHINERIQMELSYTYRFVPTDYLDNMGEFGARQGFDALQAISLTLGIQIGGHEPSQLGQAVPVSPSPSAPLQPTAPQK